MGLSRAALVCAGLFVLTSTAGGSQDRPALGSVAREKTGGVAPASRTGTEQEWIVGDVATAIQQMVTHATGEVRPRPSDTRVQTLPAAPGAVARFAVVLTATPAVTISITDHLWAPAAFAPLASAIAGPAQRCDAGGDAPVIGAMLNPRVDTIAEENARVSARLQADMRCAHAHHEAALLLGAFALREAAGGFTDPRRVISRMTAHLAVADALDRTATTPVRRLAHAVLLTLVGRQQSALDELAGLQSTRGADVLAWIRALRVRNTLDWRMIPDAKAVSLLEQLSLLRAVVTSLGDGPALDLFDRLDKPADIPDWVRLLTQGDPSVETGNRFTKHWTIVELSEAATALGAMESDKLVDDRETIARELNIEQANGPVESDGVVQVIDWGMWASAAQRHLMASLVAHHTHLANGLALPGDARSFRDDTSRTFSSLRLYPLAAATIAFNRDEAARSLATAATLARARPELVTDWVWKRLQSQATYAVTQAPGDPTAWFTPFFPAGTVFDVHVRLNGLKDEPRFNITQIAELRRLAPYSRRLIFGTVRWKGEKPSYDVLRHEFGNMASYDLGFARTLASAAWDRPEIYIPQMELACRMSPDAYWDLAPYLADHGRIEDARAAYERWLAEGRDEVAISKSMLWLVRLYFERGEHEKAVTVAQRVAEVGSFWGSVTRASLHDWRGELEQAERDHRTAWRRYDNPNELLAFYLRHGRTGPEVDELMHNVFPTGMTRTTVPLAGSTPVDGAVIAYPGALGFANGLREGDVVIAVDGIRVRNMAQYRVARGASAEEIMRLTVWRDGKYLDIPAPLRHRWVVSAVRTYDPKSQSKPKP